MADQNSLFIESSINPLLEDLAEEMQLLELDELHTSRLEVQDFIRRVFLQAHQAELSVFYPNLLAFNTDEQVRSVVGYRDGCADDLFTAQYFDLPVHERASQCLGQTVLAKDMVEVGNLAISDHGQARWVIAATTVFLAAAGYRWVLFTASGPLANAFKRLGLKPLPLAKADPNRLPDQGASWGSYYSGQPNVYLGDIHAGLQKLHSLGARRPNLQNLFRSAQSLGAQTAACRFSPSIIVGGI